MVRKLKTSFIVYVIYFFLFSPLTLGPFLLGIEKYVSSGAWVIQLVATVYTIFWFFYIYQEITISEIDIVQRRFGIKGIKVKSMRFDDMTGWKAEHPYRLYGKDDNTLVIPWTMIGKADQKFLFDTLKSLNLPEK